MRLSFKRKKEEVVEDPVITFTVEPNQKGFLFINKSFEKMLESGMYTFPKTKDKLIEVYQLPLKNQWVSVDNQGVLTQDNIGLRFSYQIQYRVENIDTFRTFATFGQYNLLTDIDQQIRLVSETLVRNTVAELRSDVINEKRGSLLDHLAEELQDKMRSYGIVISLVLLDKITFPKKIQDLFVRQLERSMQAKIDLEKAHSQVATSKVLDEAANVMHSNENVKFLQMLDTLNRMAAKGNHTFMFGGEYHQADKKDKKS